MAKIQVVKESVLGYDRKRTIHFFHSDVHNSCLIFQAPRGARILLPHEQVYIVCRDESYHLG